MKIGIGGIHIESCTFSPLLSRETDFQVLRGKTLLDRFAPFVDGLGESMPLVYARAIPGGPVEAGFYRRFKDEFLQRLAEQGPFDGLFLPMHGAVSVAGMQDAEGDFLAAVREVVGARCCITAAYDLHGNVSRRVFEAVDVLTAYRTAPHVDVPETYRRAAGLLGRCLQEDIRPHKAFVPVPVLYSGEKTSTEWEPAASLYRMIPTVIEEDAVLDASILIGYVWADEPRSSATVVAYGMDGARTEAAARKLAQAFWDVRGQFRFGVPAGSVDECIETALRSPERPVIISDSGDNPTAGGAGDTPVVLGRLLALGAGNALVAGIADREAVAQCAAAGAGGTLDLTLGGKLDSVHARPLPVRARVRSLHAVPWTLDRDVMNQIAVVEVDGVTVIVTALRTTFHRIRDFTDLSIDPRGYQIIVVKIGYLEPELKELAAKSLLVLSPGAVDQAMTGAEYLHITRPMYPFEEET